MIDNVGFNQNIQIYNKPCFRAKQENSPVTNSLNDVNLNGIDALASYNYTLINKPDKFDIPVVEPITIPKDINSIQGEKIYNSKGILECVIKENGNQKYIYWANNYDDTGIHHVEIVDKRTGKIIFSQSDFQIENIDGTKKNVVDVISYDSVTGMEQFNSSYEDGKLVAKYSTIKDSDGVYGSKCFDYSENTYRIHNYDKNYQLGNDKIYDINKNLISEFIYETKTDGYNRKEVKYSNGKPLTIKNKEAKGTDSSEYKNYLNNPNLKPTPCPEFILDINNIEGEKTYYSNGQIESVKTPDGKLYESSFGGNSVTLHDGNKTIKFIYEQNENRYVCYIDEDFGNATKSTKYFDVKNNLDGNVTYTKGNISKFVYFDNGIPSSYVETDESKEDDNLIIGIEYAPNGSVTDVYHSYEERDNSI